MEHSVSGVETENPPASYQGWVNQVLGYSRVAEGFAKGTEGGVASQTYATDNSKYYKEVSEQWATGGAGGTPSETNNSKYWNN